MRFSQTSRLSALAVALTLATIATATPPPLALKPISSGQIVSPVNISNAGDGSNRLFVCDQAGAIYIIKDGMLLPTKFLDLTNKLVPKSTANPGNYLFPLNVPANLTSPSYDERGLLGLAFHPNYNKKDSFNQPLPGFGKFYVFYSAPSPNARGNPVAPSITPPINCRTTISEFQVSGDPDVANPNSERIVISYDKPQSNHNGGQLEFGPDGYLYFSAGDGGGADDTALGHNGATNPAPAARNYSSIGNSVTVAAANSLGYTAGQEIYVKFTSGSLNGAGFDGRYTISATGSNNFTIGLLSSPAATGGQCFIPRLTGNYGVTSNAGSSTITVSTVGYHYLSVNDPVHLDFTVSNAPTPAADGVYAVAGIVDATRFTVTITPEISAGTPAGTTTVVVHPLAAPLPNLGNGQDKTSLLGKIHRIDPLGTDGPGGQYGIPASNPFVGAGNGVREEIYAYGLRNTWRFSFDTGSNGTGKLFAADVGQLQVEEIDIITAGGNYGWHAKEGTLLFDSALRNALVNGGTVRVDGGTLTLPGGEVLIDPIAQYGHFSAAPGTPPLPQPQIGASVTGGYVYRGTQIPGLVGTYVFGDYSRGIGSADGTLLVLEQVPANSNNWVLSLPTVVGGNPLTTRIYAFGRDEQGELYVATKVTQGPFQVDANGNPTGVISKIVAAQVSTALLYPSKDNSIYADFPSNSNALGSLIAGNNGTSSPRRALLAFDVAGQLPGGALVTSANVTLNLTLASSPGNTNMSLSRLSLDWGEGTSLAAGGPGQGTGTGVAATTGDATWTARFHDPTTPTLWTPAAGGTFASTPSATISVGSTVGYYAWASAQLAADVQNWLTTPSTNFGWVLLGDETASATAHVFTSREGAANVRPLLQVAYNPVAPPLTRRETWLRQYFPTPGTYVDDMADLNGNGIVNLYEYAFAFSPISANPSASGFQTTVATENGMTTYTMTFRRDPRATDLTYQLQTTDDFVTWTTIAQSTAGNTPAGAGFVSDFDVSGEFPMKIVTAVETLPAPARRFSRLKIIRSF